MMNTVTVDEIIKGTTAAYIDASTFANYAYKPQFVTNNPKEGKKVLSTIEDELQKCDSFQISVAFITMSGITPLLMTLKELEQKGIPGQILTTNYLSFSEPKALQKLQELSNITLRMFDVDAAGEGFHTKGYIFKKEEVYRIIIGSSNITSAALTSNNEWNTKIVSMERGEMATGILEEFQRLWNSSHTLDYDTFFESYLTKYQIVKRQRDIALQSPIINLGQYRLQPNSMQVAFISSLKKMIADHQEKALLISATGTGKTYAAAFAMRELGFKRVLFVVHRNEIALNAKRSFERVFGDTITTGLVSGIGGTDADYSADFVFATVSTISKEKSYERFPRDYFDACIYDEAHHSTADSYQEVMDYFRPQFTLGMTATPDRRDDHLTGKNVYELYDHNIAYEIRLQKAMEENLLCPFHYFGITDFESKDSSGQTEKERLNNFRFLASEERVRYVLEQAQYFGYSGNRVKGLIFCNSIKEGMELEKKMNQCAFEGRTLKVKFLSGKDAVTDREKSVELLVKNLPEDENKNVLFEEEEYLDYIITRDIFSEGVDIVEVNQIIMLRPTQSPIVFIQQLGRGLRKAFDKEYVVVLDFIGNYKNNYMIPVALSGDRSYNADNIRKHVISDNTTIPGASTIHFDRTAKEKIFKAIDHITGIKSIVKQSYLNLKDRLNRIPYLLDFYEHGEVDPMVIIREYGTYDEFLSNVDKKNYISTFTEQEKRTLEYLSNTILSGVRPHELLILSNILSRENIRKDEIQTQYEEQYKRSMNMEDYDYAIGILEGTFTRNKMESDKYCTVDILKRDSAGMIQRCQSYYERLQHLEFRRQIEDLVNVGMRRYHDLYMDADADNKFTLYQKYSRRDISMLMNFGSDLSSTMYGMKRSGDDVFLFVTYHKVEAQDENQYAAGKPDYADEFENNLIFRWDGQIGNGIDGKYMRDVRTARNKHLLIKKNDNEASFYYMGTFDIMEEKETTKMDNKGKMKKLVKVKMQMHNAVRDDILRYLQSAGE